MTAVNLDRVETRQDEIPSYLHPGRSARFLRNGNLIGHLGELAPSFVERLAVPTTVFLFEFDINALLAAFDTQVSFKPLPRYPASKRDLSLTAPVALPERRIRETLRSEPTLEGVLLYDLYRGEQIREEKKSLTYELSFRAPDGTLTDEQVAEAVRRIESRLRDLDVHVRTE
jgi:phenylalanyl-tRNA synthetase beta chain